MPNFEARVRHNYQDVQGLVADLNVNGMVRDGSLWRNDAPPRVMSIPTRPRFRNAMQRVIARRPELGFGVGDIPHYIFTRAQQKTFELDMDGDFGPPSLEYTIAYELQSLGPDVTTFQVLMGGNSFDLFARGNPATNYGWRTGAATGFSAGPHPAGVVLYVLKAGNIMRRYFNGVLAVSGAGQAISLGNSTLNPVITIGGDNAGGQRFDGNLRSIRIWNRSLLDDEIDYVFQTLGAGGANFSSGVWSETEIRIWDDRTSVPRRVNPSIEVPHRFMVAKFPAGGNAHIVIEATINGILVPDTGLGGDLFSVSILEKPTLTPPFVGPVMAGWSALQKIRLESEGHYTIEMRRAAGGAIIFHIDAEAV